MTVRVAVLPSAVPGGFAPGAMSRLFERFYSLASDNPLPSDVGSIPGAALALFQRLYAGREFGCTMTDNPAPAPGRADDGRTLLAFSGGKNSTAAALKLRALGRRPIPVFVRGLNRAYPNEHVAAARVCGRLGLPLRVVEVAQSGKSGFAENPIKNLFAWVILADIGAAEGIGDFAFGCLADDSDEWLNRDYGLSDAREMFAAALPLIRCAIPGATYRADLLRNETDSFVTIIARQRSLLNDILSCIMPYRFRNVHRTRVIGKFGVSLLPGRCGACYKCANESLHLHALDVIRQPAAYLRYCVGILRRDSGVVGARPAADDPEALRLFIDAARIDLAGLLRAAA